MLTGLWHSAAWNFVIWGLYFGVLLMLEKHWLSKFLEKRKVLGHIYVLILVMISFVIFNASDMKGILSDIGGLFGAGGIPFISAEFKYYLRDYAVLLAVGIIGATPFAKNMIAKLRTKKAGEKCLNILEPAFLALLLIMITAYLVDGSFNPFLYFRF